MQGHKNAYGLWLTDYGREGLQLMAYGLRQGREGLQLMAYGLRSKDYSLQTTVYGKEIG